MRWRADALESLEELGKELERLHTLYRNWNHIHEDHELNAGKRETDRKDILKRIIEVQNTMIEAVRRLCGLEY